MACYINLYWRKYLNSTKLLFWNGFYFYFIFFNYWVINSHSVLTLLLLQSGSTKSSLDVQEIKSVSSIENKVVEKVICLLPLPKSMILFLDTNSKLSRSVLTLLLLQCGSTKPKLDVQKIESVSSIENKAVEKVIFLMPLIQYPWFCF